VVGRLPPNTRIQPTPLPGPQDRSFFEGQHRLRRDPDLAVAAQLMGRPLGRGLSDPHLTIMFEERQLLVLE